MEQKENQTQQDPALIKKEKNSKTLLVVLVSVLLTTLLVGGGVFFGQQSVLNEKTADLNYQLEQLRNDNIQLRTILEELEKTVIDTTVQNEELEKEASEATAEKEEIEEKTCKGVWVNGVCVKSTCVDSDVNEKPDDIYIKGNVTYTDENGVETVVYDECTGSKIQVNEMWCYESPSGSGNYVQGKMVYDCEKGCLDGACIK